MSWKILYTWSCCVSSAMGSMGLLLQVFPASSTSCLTHSCSTYVKRKVMKTLNEEEPLWASPTAAIHPHQPRQQGMGWDRHSRAQLSPSSQANRSNSTSHLGKAPPGEKEQSQELLSQQSYREVWTGWGTSQHTQNDPLVQTPKVRRGDDIRKLCREV